MDNALAPYPSVSIAIPVYNEEVFIQKIIRQFLETKYPNLIEIIVADGGSTDRTKDLVNQISTEDSRVYLIYNPQKLQSNGLNLCLKLCRGDVFLRADAHADYAPDYIERCIDALLESKALNVGGAQRFVAQSPFQAGVALAVRSPLGSGRAKYRSPNYSGYADTVYLGCFWKQALLDVSGFDTSQVTNQDAELNQKLLQKSPQAIYVSSLIRVWYYPRKTWKTLFVQYFRYGRGRYLTSIKHSSRLQLRGKLPFLFISSLILLFILDLAFPRLGFPVGTLIFISTVLILLEALRVTLVLRPKFDVEIWRGKDTEVPSTLSLWLFCSLALLSMPIAHFSGYAYQMSRHTLLRKPVW